MLAGLVVQSGPYDVTQGANRMAYRVGVDIGGTFTDFCAFNDESNELHALKVLSRPDEPGAEVIEGLAQLEERFNISPKDIVYLTHGTTVGVNTVIQKKGIRLGLFTTENFADVLEIARLKMPDPYDLKSRRADPLVPKDQIFAVRERMSSDGSTDVAVDENTVVDALERARLVGAEGIVVALINAYRNPAHEQQVAAIVKRLAPELPVFCSSEVWSIVREYERTLTAVIHSYVQPRVSHYLTSLQNALRDAGVSCEALVTKSNGGVMSAELGKTECAQMILSGTAAGVIGASHVAKLAGYSDVISFDVGGTSADVAFIQDGNPQYGVGETIGDYPIYIPTVSVTSIGAGGGSIAWLDELGVLKVGPESAGADPGPACYGKGANRATITDAFAVLGFVGQFDLGYQTVQINVEAAREVIGTLASSLSMNIEETAQAIVRIAVSGMYLEVSKLMSSYGADPRDNAMLAFGGAGPMTACFLAEELGVSDVVVPPTPGVLSALGGLIADLKNDFIKTVYLDLDSDCAPVIKVEFDKLREQGTQWLRDEQGYDGEFEFIYSADMRYRGQSFEVEAVLDPNAIESGDLASFAEAFHHAHLKLYNHSDDQAPVQMVNLRLVAIGQNPKPVFAQHPVNERDAEYERTISIYENATLREVPLYLREQLRPGDRVTGPSVVAQEDTTVCIVAGFEGRVDGFGNLLLHRGPQ